MNKAKNLDPVCWDEFSKVSHQMLDQMIDFLKEIRQRPVWQSVPDEVKKSLDEPVPYEGENLAAVCEQFTKDILPYPTGNIHPRFWGWVMGTGTGVGMLAEMLTGAMNSHVAGYDQSATLIEKQVLLWLSELMGFSNESSGLLVSGGTMANLTGLIVARNNKAPFDIREEGLQVNHQPKLLVYGSQETHSWAQKACETLGLGKKAFRSIEVNTKYQINLQKLEQMIDKDQKLGHFPFCVIGNAGTVNTGAVDDLESLAQICQKKGLWFHIDGAFGALALLSPSHKSKVKGIEKADSLAFDLHKWGYIPYEVGCILIQDKKMHKDAFCYTSDYLLSAVRGISVNATYFAELGLQLSRGFRALKVWMSLKNQGVKLWGKMIEKNIKQAKYLEQLIDNNTQLQLLAPVSLNIVCFRFFSAKYKNQLNSINKEILLCLQESGTAVLSSTLLNGVFALRVANTNHRSENEDFDLLAQEVVAIGQQIVNSKCTCSM